MIGSWFEKSERLLNRIGEVVAPVQNENQELFISIRRRDWPRTHELLSSPNVDALGKNGSVDMTPLHVACAEDFVQCVEYLLVNGADVNVRDTRAHETPLHHGARGGHSRVCRLLVERGASLVARNARNQTPYDVAKDLSLRQWLLPLQLRAEAELEGPKQQIGLVPPPTIGGAGSSSIHDPTRRAINWQPPPPPPPPIMMPQQQPLPQGISTVQSTITVPIPPPPHSTTAQNTGPPEIIESVPITTSPDVTAPQDRVRKNSLTSAGPLSSVANSVISETTNPASRDMNESKISAPSPTVASLHPQQQQQFAPPPPLPAEQTSVAVLGQDQKQMPPQAGNYSFVSKRQDFTGRYADGFHSSSSDPILAAKYGHQNVKDYSHLPPPPVMSAPPNQSPTVEPSKISTALGARRYVSYNPTICAPHQQMSSAPPIHNYQQRATVFTPPPITGMSKADRFQTERASMLQRMQANPQQYQTPPIYSTSQPSNGDEEGKFI